MQALLLDFNGTISDDEPLLCRIFMELFAHEKPLSEEEYYDRLAGLADREIVHTWLGRTIRRSSCGRSSATPSSRTDRR